MESFVFSLLSCSSQLKKSNVTVNRKKGKKEYKEDEIYKKTTILHGFAHDPNNAIDMFKRKVL